MAYDTKPGWSSVFVRPATSRLRRTGRRAVAGARDVTGPSVQNTIDEFLGVVDDGSARDRYGRAFTDEAGLELHWNLGGHVAEALGAMSLSVVRRRDVEALVDELGAKGLSRSRLRAVAASVRTLYDYAIERALVRHNPAERIAIADDDETQQPSGGTISDHAISTALRVATLGFLVTAVTFLAESL